MGPRWSELKSSDQLIKKGKMRKFISTQYLESFLNPKFLSNILSHFLVSSLPMINLHQQDAFLILKSLRSSHASNKGLNAIELERSVSSHSSRLKEIPKSIQVLSDEEEKLIIDHTRKQEALRLKIEQAKLTKSKTNILRVLYIELHFKGHDQQLKEKQWNGLVKAYISRNLKTNKNEPFDIRNSYFFQPLMPNPDDEYIENEYILYGCDIISHTRIQKMFQFYAPSIKWIDSSHCKLTFLQKLKGWEAVVNNSRDLDQLLKDQSANLKVQNLMKDLQLDNQQMEQQYENKYNQEYAKLDKSKKQFHLLKHYVELMPYFELGFRRRLMIRNVTVAEQKIGYILDTESKSNKSFSQDAHKTKNTESDFKKYLKVKENLWREIQNDPLVKPMWEMIEKQMQKEQELLILQKRTKPKLQIRHNTNQSNYNISNGQTLKNGSTHESKHFYGQGVDSNPRYRSRDNTARYNQDQRGGYRDRGQRYGNYNRYDRREHIQHQFDMYIEQREGLRVIQNPHKYLEPEFVDHQTGTHFYKNPFYKPELFQKKNSFNHLQSNHYQSRNDFNSYPSSNHDQQNHYNPSEYEYRGNRQSDYGNYSTIHNQRAESNHYGNRIKNGKNPFYQGQHNSERNPSSRRSSFTEDQFNHYLAERQSAKNTQQTSQPRQSLTGSCTAHSEIDQKPLQNVFQGDPDFSIITEEKSHTSLQRNEYINQQNNLENILHQIDNLEGQPRQPDDEECEEGVEFILTDQKPIKRQVKTEISHRNFGNPNGSTNRGYIEEKIKQENLGKWMNSNHEVEELSQLSKLNRLHESSTGGYDKGDQDCTNGRNEKISKEPVKKKIPRKKQRSNSKSSRKREGESLSKNLNI